LPTCLYGHFFIITQDGEEVRFNIEVDERGRKRAADVTGPDGGYVQGAQQRRRMFRSDSDGEY